MELRIWFSLIYLVLRGKVPRALHMSGKCVATRPLPTPAHPLNVWSLEVFKEGWGLDKQHRGSESLQVPLVWNSVKDLVPGGPGCHPNVPDLPQIPIPQEHES